MGKRRWLVSAVTIIAVLGLCAGIIAADDQPLLSRGPRQHWLSAASDGSGGVIVAWTEETSLYAQRVNASGELMWDENLLISETCSLFHQSLIADGTGGVIASWEDDTGIENNPLRSGHRAPVPFFIRKITGDGKLTWDENPVSAGRRLEIVPDGTGGVIFAWNRFTIYQGYQTNDFLYVQKITANGDKAWNDPGRLIIASTDYETITNDRGATVTTHILPSYTGSHSIAGDGTGGVYLCWSEKTSPSTADSYLQHLDSNGNPALDEKAFITDKAVHGIGTDPEGGVIFKTAGTVRLTGDTVTHLNLTEIHVDSNGKVTRQRETETYLDKFGDGTGNTFLLTEVEVTRLGDGFSLISKLDPDGAVLWEEKAGFADDGKKHLGTGYLPDERGGLYAVQDTYITSIASRDIRAGKLDENGERAWADDGIPVFDIPGVEYQNGAGMIGDGNGVIIVGILGDTALYGDMVYVQKIDTNGNLLWGGGVCVSR